MRWKSKFWKWINKIVFNEKSKHKFTQHINRLYTIGYNLLPRKKCDLQSQSLIDNKVLEILLNPAGYKFKTWGC